MKPSHLYVAAFSGGLLKVGRANSPASRIAQHRARLAVAGVTLLQQHSQQCVGEVSAAEARLIRRCTAACTERRADEWFMGLAFDEVCAWANQEAGASDEDVAAVDGGSLYVRRDCFPFPVSGGYICRACCRVHIGQGSAYLCQACVARGYVFDGALRVNGSEVPLWSGIEPGTEARPFHGVSCEELRPDVPWMRVFDPEWSYGRPLIDYASALPKVRQLSESMAKAGEGQ